MSSGGTSPPRHTANERPRLQSIRKKLSLKGKRSASKVGQSGLFRNLKAVYFVIFTSQQALRLNRRAKNKGLLKETDQPESRLNHVAINQALLINPYANPHFR